MQVQSLISTDKNSQTSKASFYNFFSALWDKMHLTKVYDTPPYARMYKLFKTPKLSETFRNTKRAPHEFFLRHEFFVIPSLLLTKILEPDRWASPTLSFSQLVYFWHCLGETKKMQKSRFAKTGSYPSDASRNNETVIVGILSFKKAPLKYFQTSEWLTHSTTHNPVDYVEARWCIILHFWSENEYMFWTIW